MSKQIKQRPFKEVSKRTVNGWSLSKISRKGLVTHPSFNFAFVTSKNKFGLKVAKKHVRYEGNLLTKLNRLSKQKDLASCISLSKDSGIEPLPESVIKPRINSKFLKSKVYRYCNPSFYSFRTSRQGRVIGYIWQAADIFYILFLDPDHKAYKG